MTLLTLAEVVFFLAFGISQFYPFKHSHKVAAIAAIVVGVLLVVKF